MRRWSEECQLGWPSVASTRLLPHADVLMGDVMPDILEMRRKAQESRPGKRHAEDEDGEEKPAAKRPQGKMHAFLAQQQST